MSGKVRVGIFVGGRSVEHEVSVSSAESVLRAIDRDRFEPYVIFIDREGRWRLPSAPAPELPGGATLAGLLGSETPVEHSERLARHEVVPVRAGDSAALAPRAVLRPLADSIDVALLVLHGPFGEDGTLQGFLEMAGIPYTGAGVMASALAMDKVVFKDLMRGHDLPTVDYVWFRHRQWRHEPDRVLREVTDALGPKVIVKPARLGSSVGMTLAHEPPELPDALEEAFRYDAKVIVEAYVPDARELECGVLGNEEPIVFEPGEVRSHHEFYDYAAKYVEGEADVIPRAAVDPELAAQVKELSLAAYRAVDAAGMARVDFLVPPGAVYISEMNTIPGFTTTSMFPKQAALAGIDFTELISRLIDLGLAAAREGRTPGSPGAERDE